MPYDERNDNKKGTIKTLVSKLTIRDSEVSSIIKKSISEAGYDLVITTIFEKGTHYFVGEEIEIFRTELVR